jgi:bisphosphoglycerate-independent phosphoglycerate mutase (AlkP superfamily)
VTLVITSDHGNAEEPWHHTHSRNPVPFIAVGPAAATVPSALDALTGVAPWLRVVLGGQP